MLDAERSNSSPSPMNSSEMAIALAIFIAALAYFNLTLHLTFERRDEGFLLFNIARVAHGEVPHRDFIEVYGPGVYALTAPVFRVFGERVMPVRELLAVLRAAAVAFSYLIARHFVPRPFALLGTSVAMAYWGWSIWSLTTPYAALFTIPLCMLSLLLLLIGESRGSRGTYVLSGFVCGAALLFKWSLAAMSAYGMVLAICAGAMLREPSVAAPRSYRVPVLVAWVLAGALVVVPFRSSLTALDYLLHLAPIHTLLALVAIRFARFGDGRSAFARATPLVARYAAGFLVAPVLVATLYLSWGSLGDLIHNTVTRPLNYSNYYIPSRLPRLESVSLLICIGAFVTGGLALLRGSRRLALAFAVLGSSLVPFAWPSLRAGGSISSSLEHLITRLPAIVAFATLSLVTAILARPRPFASERALAALIAALFFQEMMTFQIFPRGGYNVTLMLGTLAPLVAYLAHRWYAFAAAGEAPASRLRRAVAFLLVAALPALFVGEKVRFAISAPSPRDLAHTAFDAPSLEGIHPKPELYERDDLAAFDALIRELDRAEPPDAPVFALNNEPMIYFASGRDPLFEDHLLILFLAGWDLLPENDRDAPSAAALIERLERRPETILVVRQGDTSTANLMTFYPQLLRYVRENYRVEDRVGKYRILRRVQTR
jgi:hypothetical protein